ncbi:acyl carrier protein [Chthonomonas calidirosea]|uniref:Acyl carrier protein n=1 Tax=Chthonomonas calidirosea (strain DSM 23976 / ICMP 18418 / T49) TaxID=1303518 RepID=S0ESD6_CHTCT|nr:acyl carrier protein [Chthonomonas calidirosea]CCW34074.1 acyl carrier protein [Chthonomonas calidirosea T49]CEK14691.1 acyl carrier protein [Chthonomonas calidirosea]CEK15828.1 acyl carrier protein [Chthonomonas calidirosea]
MSTTFDRVRKVLLDRLDVTEEEIVPEASLVNDLKADSLDVMEIVLRLEDEFTIDIPDEDAEKIVTVQDIVDYIDKKAAAS